MNRAGEQSSDHPAHGAPFVWPPRAPSAVVPRPVPARSAPLAEARVNRPGSRFRLWRAFEDAWLAPVAEPLPDRIERLGWRPDEWGVYCDRCAASVGPHEHSEFGCAACRGRRLPWSRIVRLGAHREPLRGWIHELKFTRWRRLGVDLGAALGQRVREAGAPSTRICIVPVPMPWRRRLVRGVDHAEALAEGVARALDAPLVRALGRRWKPVQRGLSASTRARNVNGVFFRAAGVDLSGWTVVLVDDVRTTGATLRAACRALNRRRNRRGRELIRAGKPADIWAAVIACAETRADAAQASGAAQAGRTGV